MGDVAHDVVWDVVVRVDMEARHLVPPLEAAVHVVVARLPHHQRRVPLIRGGHPILNHVLFNLCNIQAVKTERKLQVALLECTAIIKLREFS